MGVRAAAFLAGLGTDHGGHGVAHQVLQLQRLHQVAVPDQSAVGHRHVGHAVPHLLHFRGTLRQGLAVAEHRGMALHGALHLEADVGHLGAAVRMAGAVEALERGLARLGWQRRLGGARCHDLRRAMRRGAAEHDQIEQRVAAQPVRPVHRDAGAFAHRHQPGDHGVRILRRRAQHLAVVVRRDTAHVVVHRGQHRDRRLGDIDAGEHLGGLGNPRQALVQQLRTQMFQVQHDIFLVGTAATPFGDLDRHRARNDVAGGEVLRGGRIALHEPLALGVGEIAALAARAFGDQAAGGEDPRRVELHELHVLARQAGAQHHAVAVAGAGVRGGAGQEGPPVAAGGQHHGLRAETVDRAVVQAPGDDAAADAFLGPGSDRGRSIRRRTPPRASGFADTSVCRIA